MTPSLKHYDEFKRVLASYRMSDNALQVIGGLKLVLLPAATATGRSAVIKELLKTGSYHYLISDTTRPPRINDGVMEENGREYWFRKEEEMLADLQAGKFLEAELIHNQQVSGISIRELEKARQEGKTAITEADIEGVHNILRAKPDTLVIMLLPPNFDEWQKRIVSRGHMSDQEYKRRVESAKQVWEDGIKQSYYRFVVNDNVEHAAQTVDAQAQGKSNPQHSRGIEVIHELQSRLQQKLDSMYF